MVKVIIQMDGTQDREFFGEFVHVVTASDAGGKYEAQGGIFGEIEPDELPSVLAQATAKTIKQTHEHLESKDCIVAMIEFSKLFQIMILDEIVENKEALDLSEKTKGLLDIVTVMKEGMRNGN